MNAKKHATHAEKTAIILMGGGMRSAHGAGFLYTLATELGITTPDIMIGGSGDAGNVAYFAAGQYASLRHIWCDLLSTSRFISLLRPWRVMNVDYVIDTVFKKLDPLDTEALQQSPIDWHLSLTDYANGAAHYIGKDDNVDLFETLRASKAIPLLYGKKVPIEGRLYFDGEVGRTLAEHAHKAKQLGASRIVVINHGGHSLVEETVLQAFGGFVSPGLQHAITKQVTNHTTCVYIPGAQVYCVAPKNLPAGVATRNKQQLRATFARGVADARAMKEDLRELFLKHEPGRA